MKIFDTYEDVGGMNACMKRPIVVQARQIHEEFRVNTLEGNYKKGKAGDYLMRGVDAELYICDQAIFEKTYDFITDKELAGHTGMTKGQELQIVASGVGVGRSIKMNERIRELAKQAGFKTNWQHEDVQAIKMARFEKFAQLIVAECIDTVSDCSVEYCTRPQIVSEIREHFGVEE